MHGGTWLANMSRKPLWHTDSKGIIRSKDPEKGYCALFNVIAFIQ